MDYIADLHVHSPHSRATSRESTLAGLLAWARVKGIQVVATGDFTHPGWFATLQNELEPAEPGLFRLKNEAEIPAPLAGVAPSPRQVRFLLSAEVSSIYKRHGATRKVHNLLYVPDFASAARINATLAGIGNIESDGRPILGLDSRNLLEILLEKAPEGFLVPAHIWTPWFSLFGSRSGFDAIEECFDDLTPHVFALETGLSSDPAMNRLVSALDRFAFISNSDCHSPQKLGREANLFSTSLDFFSLRDTIRENRRESFRGTVEFFPEEGKYHADGHRACGVCLDPHETRRLGLLCPVCGKPLTVGVEHRVLELADREEPLMREDAPEFFSLIPLPEVLGEIVGAGPSSKEVVHQYGRCIARFGSEFELLLQTPVTDIASHSPLLAEAVTRMREGRVIRQPGYDGEFGVIRVFEEGEVEKLAGQGSLFGDGTPRRTRRKKEKAPLPAAGEKEAPECAPTKASGPNPEQEAAVAASGRHLLVAAGPGTGKTFTLVARLAALLAAGEEPERVVAITFTTRAAEEVAERLEREAGPSGERVFVGTFHAFCLGWLRREVPGLAVVGPEGRERLLKRLFPALSASERGRVANEIEAYHLGTEAEAAVPSDTVRRYLDELARANALDLEGIIPFFVRCLEESENFRELVSASVAHLFVDEFQDLNASQFRLVQILGRNARVFAIGDPDQAIYGFRGSHPEYFFRFAALPGVERLSLTRNYRSASPIVEAAGAVISRNSQGAGFSLSPQNRVEGGIESHSATTPAAEAEFIVRRIEELMGGIEHFSHASGRGGDRGAGRGRSFADFAILFRLGKQAGEIATALERRGIPFQLVGGTPFHLSPAVRSAHYFLQAAAGLAEMDDWLNLLRALPGVGEATIGRLEEKLPLGGDFFAALPGLGLPPAAEAAISELSHRLEAFRVTSRAGVSPALAPLLPFLAIDSGCDETNRLLKLAGSFGTDHVAFARHLRRHGAETVYDERAEAVSLMTLHAAKGLEFPVVFLTGLEEGLLPCTLMGTTDVEEERRLFYVGMTRAKERLVLTSAATRPWAGPGERQLSRFVGELPARLVSPAETGPRRKSTREPAQLELF